MKNTVIQKQNNFSITLLYNYTSAKWNKMNEKKTAKPKQNNKKKH